MKLNKTIKRGYLGLVGCCGVLGLLTVAMLCPISSNGASALVTDDGSPTTVAQSTEARMYIQSVVSVSLQNSVEFDITPSTAGTFGAGTAQLSVNTNSSDGYSVFMKTENGESTLKNAAGNTVGAVSGTQTPSGFAKNTWGYALGKGISASTASYKAVPTSATTAVISTDTSSAGGASDTYTLAFGAKIGTDLPTGEYTNNVVISVIANPETVTSLTQLTSMQEMTADICKTTPEHAEKQLIDDRDGSSYWVTKMKDGNCWMTQNLALNINSTNGVLASNASGNGTFTWKGTGDGTNNLPKTTETTVPAAVSGGGPQTDTRSWNLGKYVLSNPSDGTSCTVNAGESISKCTRFIDVSGADWKPTFQATTDASGNITAYNAAAKTYDAHYLIGNYYQYNTATAGTGAAVTTDGANASASICPSGNGGNWVLPLSGTANNNVSGSFYNLLNQYNATSGTSGATTIVQLPLAFVRSGWAYIDGGAMYNVGQYGFYWSRTSKSATNAYDLYIYTTSVYPSNDCVRRDGFSLRCLYAGSA